MSGGAINDGGAGTGSNGRATDAIDDLFKMMAVHSARLFKLELAVANLMPDTHPHFNKHDHEWLPAGNSGAGGGDGPSISTTNYACFCGAKKQVVVSEPRPRSELHQWP